MATPAIFLDRDGTLIEDVGYIDRLERLRMYPWSIEAVRMLRRVGYAVVVVTNQAGVARGMVEERVVIEVRDHIQSKLGQVGERLDGHYYCPHLPDAPLIKYRCDCLCHKPKPGMVMQAAEELTLDLRRSVVVGDRKTDIELAQSVGARGILVKTGYGPSQEALLSTGKAADLVTSDLLAAVGWILNNLPRPDRK